MKRLFFSLVIIIAATTLCANAQRADRTALSPEDRQKWLSEMRDFKHEFLARELELTQEQQDAFFPIYDQMEDELNQISEETRKLESKVRGDSEATDLEMEAAARALFEQTSKEGAVQITYFELFKNTLSPKQLISLKNAERNFTKQLVKHQGRSRQGAQGRN